MSLTPPIVLPCPPMRAFQETEAMRPFDDVRLARAARIGRDVRVVQMRRVGGSAGDPPIAVRVLPRRGRDGSVDRDVPAIWRRSQAPAGTR